MHFEAQTIYHIFNQGNNKQPIFFLDENYIFFLRKMRKHLLPFADILCYCLMPNHFHFLVYVKEEGAERQKSLAQVQRSDGLKPSNRSASSTKQNLTQGIATLLSSYTQAINKQENRTGSLFRPKTKAKPFLLEEFITVNHKDWMKMDYANYCFQYIHQNPVKARLVEKPEDWVYSSAKDYLGLRNGILCNQEKTNQLGIHY